MGGYQSNLNGSLNILRNKGFLLVVENRPFPPGRENDVWIIDGAGAVGAMFNVNNGDILQCIETSAGGNNIQGAYIVIPRDPDFVEEWEEGV